MPLVAGYGPLNDGLNEILGGVDLNGDGFDDVLIGGPNVDHEATNTGAVYILYGRNQTPADTMLMDCTVKTVDRMIGATNDYRFGSQIAPLGDLNQDGCEDVAIGANLANLGPNNQGAIHIVYGWGGSRVPGESDPDRPRARCWQRASWILPSMRDRTSMGMEFRMWLWAHLI